MAGTPQYVWKVRAITTVADAIRANLKPTALPEIAIVPIPPSKPVDAPGYDDRMIRVARAVNPNVDVRELLVTTSRARLRMCFRTIATPRTAHQLGNRH